MLKAPSKNKTLFIFFLICATISYSQNKDTAQAVKKEVRIYKESQFNNNDTTYSGIDTLLDGYQIYTNRNNLGNIGLASVKQTLGLPPDIGFNYAPNNYSFYKYNTDDIKYYNTKTPYTEVLLVMGAKKEQDFSFVHTQNVNKNLNFAATFQRIRSDGFYEGQSINHNCGSISSNYKTHNNRYSLLSNIIYNNLQNAENGGIVSDSAFEYGGNQDKKLIPVNLDSARRRETERNFYFKQFFNFGYIEWGQINDSVSKSKLIPTSILSHSLFIQGNARSYADNQSKSEGFYSDFYNDTSRTKDSSYFWKIENKISWQTTVNKTNGSKRKIGTELAVMHQYMEVKQYIFPNMEKQNVYFSSFSNIIPQARLFNYDHGQNLFYDIYGKYVASGFNKGNYDYGITLKQLINKDKRNYLQLKGTAREQAPEFFYQNYISNHFKWNNQFSNISTQNIDLRFVSEKIFFEAGCSIIQYKNYVYLDYTATPEQFNPTFKVFSAFLKKDVHIKRFTISNNIIYQKTIDSAVVNLPSLITHESFFFSLDLFKKALETQIGIDLFYNTSYYANAYMPATGMFYLQNQKQIGNYPYLDFFLSMKIKTARIFFKYEHFNSAFMGNTYYSTLHYPMPDNAFKFGISWKFFD